MNTVSLFLYASGVFAKLGGFILVAIVILLAFAIVSTIAKSVENDEFTLPKSARNTFGGAIFLALTFSFIPNERTMLLIAASQMVEAAANTEVGSNAIRLLNKKITTRLQDLDNRRNQSSNN